MSIQLQRLRRKRKQKTKFMVRTQWGNDWKREPVDDYGTFSKMMKKYGTEKYTYWCAQIPPHRSYENGEWMGYRLDGNEAVTFKHYGNRTGWSLARYGRHKAWISPDLKIDGKRVILVANAGVIQ